jgi:hypothetical protein
MLTWSELLMKHHKETFRLKYAKLSVALTTVTQADHSPQSFSVTCVCDVYLCESMEINVFISR